MRIILFLITLSLYACAGSPTKKQILAEKRMPIGNSSMIQMQEHIAEDVKVDRVINEYRFNDDFNQAPISEVTLNQSAPDYMLPEVPDDPAYIASVEAKEEFKAVPFEPNAYPALASVPRKKISTDGHKKILAKKEGAIKSLKKKAVNSSRSMQPKAQPPLPGIKPVSQSSKAEIESKLKQLQENATTEKIVVKDKIAPAPLSKPASQSNVIAGKSSVVHEGPSSIDIGKSAPVPVPQVLEDVGVAPAIPAPPPTTVMADSDNKLPAIPVIPEVKTVPSPDLIVDESNTPSLPQDKIADTSGPVPPSIPQAEISETSPISDAPSIPALPSAPVATSVAGDDVKVSMSNAQPKPTTPKIDNKGLSGVSDARKLESTADGVMKEVGSEFRKITSRKIKVNKDQSVEVYDSKPDQIPPLPVMPALPK